MLFSESLARGRSGDPEAQEELFGRWRPLLRLQARKLLGPELSARVDPSDVVQDSLAQCSQDLARFRGTSQGEWVTWLRCIVAGQAAKARRFHHANRRSVIQENQGAALPSLDSQNNPVDQLMETEEAARLADALTRLPATVQEVVVRRILEAEPKASVARALGLTPKAVKTLLAQGLDQLRRFLERGS
jgi:RNA polymerase sigma-70 factor (ECF subfamily)